MIHRRRAPKAPLGLKGSWPEGPEGIRTSQIQEHFKIRTILVGAGLCSARRDAPLFTIIFGKFVPFFCGQRYILQCRNSYQKFASAVQLFLLLLQKKKLQKENEPGGISISPRSPLEPTRKTASVFLNFSREIWNSSEFRTLQELPLGTSGALGAPAPVVGVDAHIDPAGCTVFTGICGEFVTAQWADRVVGPYGKASIASRIS